MTVEPALPPPAPGEDIDDAAARYRARIRRSVKNALKRLRQLDKKHGGGTVALANMGSHGVRLVFVANDGTFGDTVVPSVAAADQVCSEGGWEIAGWDNATIKRIAPSAADRRRMAGSGR